MAKYYESDVTRLIRELLEKQPEIVEEQRKGRSFWWDKKIDLDALRRLEDSKVPPSPYAYQNYACQKVKD